MIRVDSAVAGLADGKATKAVEPAGSKAVVPPRAREAAAESADVEVRVPLRNRAQRDDLRRLGQQGAAVAAADVAAQGLAEQRQALIQMRTVAAEAHTADFRPLFPQPKDLGLRFAALARKLDDTAQQTRFGGQSLLDGTQKRLEVALDATTSASAPLTATTSKALGFSASLVSPEDARAAVLRIDDVLTRLGDDRGKLSQFRDTVAAKADATRAARLQSGSIRGGDDALSLVHDVTRKLRQDSGAGVSVGAQMLSQAQLPQNALALLR